MWHREFNSRNHWDRFGSREILLAPFLRLRIMNWVSGEIDGILFHFFCWNALLDFIREDFFRHRYGMPNFRFPLFCLIFIFSFSVILRGF